MKTVIDGQKLLKCLDVSEDEVTPEAIAQKLMLMEKTEVDTVLASCVIYTEPEPTLCSDVPTSEEFSQFKCFISASDSGIRKRLKYEKNYLARIELRRSIEPGAAQGKHYYGKHKRR